VIGPKQHFTSPKVKAYFQVDLERLRSYGLARGVVHALAAWAIYKIRRVLIASRDGVADLRTECKFETTKTVAKLVDQDTGEKKDFDLPPLNDDLRTAFQLLKTDRDPIKVRWVPNIEGKAELPDGVSEDTLNRQGLEGKSKIEAAKPKKGAKSQDQKKLKRLLIIYGEWSAADKQRLREQNGGEPARAVVERAIKDYEARWEAKAQSRKPETDKEEENEGGDE
jgi:hypothetical protein